MKKTNKVIVMGVVFAVSIIVLLFIFLLFKNSSKGKSTDSMIKKINVTKQTPVKASISLEDNTLYDELPEITKYPLAVQGKGDVVIEIMTSPEKAGENYEAWLIDVANKFNSEEHTTEAGLKIGLSIRPVSSGLAADYIISNKHTPQLFTPSNYLWGEYINANGGDVTEKTNRLVGNTAGLLISKNSTYKTYADIIGAVKKGEINIGYTNPQTSSTGMNLLLSILKDGDADMFSDKAVESFTTFQQNIPFVAYNTMQMRDSAKKGTLDGMILEYQTYINEENINKMYDFVPFGVRHDNPLYIVNEKYLSDSELEAIDIITDYCLSGDMQTIATQYGFNANNDYSTDVKYTGAEVNKALEIYKANKDNGQDIIAVFVADCSGSMYVTIEVPIAKFDLDQKAYFQGGINRLQASGSTASYDAIVVAMDMIEKAQKDNPNAKRMIFLLSDGQENVGYSLETIKPSLKDSKIPVYTISYTAEADTAAMKELSEVNEAATINADSEDIVYKIKSLFNSQM